MYIIKNTLCMDPFGNTPATYDDLLSALPLSTVLDLAESQPITKMQNGYVSRNLSYGESVVRYSARKKMLYVLRPSYFSTGYCFRSYFARVLNVDTDGAFSLEVLK